MPKIPARSRFIRYPECRDQSKLTRMLTRESLTENCVRISNDVNCILRWLSTHSVYALDLEHAKRRLGDDRFEQVVLHYCIAYQRIFTESGSNVYDNVPDDEIVKRVAIDAIMVYQQIPYLREQDRVYSELYKLYAQSTRSSDLHFIYELVYGDQAKVQDLLEWSLPSTISGSCFSFVHACENGQDDTTRPKLENFDVARREVIKRKMF